MTLIIGIDPGINGGYAVWDTKGEIIAAYKMSDTYSDLVMSISSMKGNVESEKSIAYMEQLSTFMGRRAQHNALLFKSYGAWEMLCAALQIPLRLVPPKTWQEGVKVLSRPPKLIKTMSDSEQSAWYRQKKKAHKVLAARLFPHIKVTDYIADALLIAEYGRLKEAGKVF